MRRRIVLLLSGLKAHGGIQRYNRSFCKALTEYADHARAELDVLSLHDPPGWHDARFLARPLRGYDGNRIRFGLGTLAALAKPCDLVIVGHIDLGPLVLPLRLIRPHAPILASTYGIEVWTPLPAMKRLALRCADRIWTISAYTADQLISQQGVATDSIQVVPVPLDPDFLTEVATRHTARTTKEHITILTISRMNVADADKGIDCVIAALPQVRLQVPHVRYVIVGNGNDRPRLERLAHEHGVADIVHFAGRISDEHLHTYLSCTELLVLPSRKEGFGIVFLEAMAYHKPVIAGAHGGSPEVVIDGETGILVDHGDRAALVRAITDLLQNTAKRRAMGEAGFQRVHSVYSYGRFRTTVMQTLNQLLQISLFQEVQTFGHTEQRVEVRNRP